MTSLRYRLQNAFSGLIDDDRRQKIVGEIPHADRSIVHRVVYAAPYAMRHVDLSLMSSTIFFSLLSTNPAKHSQSTHFGVCALIHVYDAYHHCAQNDHSRVWLFSPFVA